ncbi:MAG TPA: trypsin-like serine protease, partial [Streptosporangiaceae bacterium]|nr:trypsin-like serine protease [Streptosporangiaceae bacterium]
MRLRAARQARLRGGEESTAGDDNGPRKRARWFPRTPAAVAIVTVTVLTVGVVATVTPAEGAAGDIASSFARAVRHLVSTSQNGQDFAGTPAVGALFTMSKGKLGRHFCTASVIGSPHGDLVITAAHCVTGTSGIVFVPGYDRGAAPYGIWTVTKIYVDRSWTSSSNPDDDVAFLRVSQAGSTVPIEDVTGAEALKTGTPARQRVEVIGYPDSGSQPIVCRNWTREPMS